MADTLSKPIPLGSGWYSITATGDLAAAALVYWRVNGAKYHVGPEKTLTFQVLAGSSAQVWASSDGWGDDDAFYPNFLILQGFVDESAGDVASVKFQEYTGGQWVTLAQYLADDRGWYHYTTDPIPNGDYRFGMLPVGTNSNDGTRTEFTGEMVTYPDVPDVSYAYDQGTAAVTVSAA